MHKQNAPCASCRRSREPRRWAPRPPATRSALNAGKTGASFAAHLTLAAVHLAWHNLEQIGPLSELPKYRRQLEAAIEERATADDVEAETRATHGDNEAANVAQMADHPRSHEREDHIIVLLALILVDRRDGARHADERMLGAALREHVVE